MATLRLIRVAEPMIDSSSVDDKYQPPEIKMSPSETHLVIGRNNGTHRPDFCLESSLNRRMISRKHATVERTPQGFKIYDHSLNGTYVNYSRLMSVGGTLLKPGNVITFGHLNGANIRQGETVPEYATDLKYRVEIIENNEPSRLSVSGGSGAAAAGSAVSPTSRKKSKAPIEETNTSVVSKASSKRQRDSTASATKNKKMSNNRGSTGKGGKSKAVMNDDPMGDELAEEYHNENEQCNAVVCKKPLGANIDWIQCDGCEGWYHQICVGVSDVDDNDTYLCPACDN